MSHLLSTSPFYSYDCMPYSRLFRNQVQEYYNVVKNPIDLTMIQKRIRSEEYPAIEDFQKDVEQLVENAKAYYDTTDKEYVDGCALYAVFKKTLAKEPFENFFFAKILRKIIMLQLESCKDHELLAGADQNPGPFFHSPPIIMYTAIEGNGTQRETQV